MHVTSTPLYDGFMKMDRLTITQDGHAFTREVVRRRPAACVLAYDPALDVVLLVEELRAGNIAAGLPEADWISQGPIAGVVDEGYTPMETARKEAVEEAGLVLNGPLHGPFSTLVSPGGNSEIIHHFIAFCDLSSVTDGATFGLAAENEHTTVRLVSRTDALAMLTAPAPINGLLATCLLHLDRLL